jgi:hypothetical protein
VRDFYNAIPFGKSLPCCYYRCVSAKDLDPICASHLQAEEEEMQRRRAQLLQSIHEMLVELQSNVMQAKQNAIVLLSENKSKLLLVKSATEEFSRV